jgi:hypothetical protein
MKYNKYLTKREENITKKSQNRFFRTLFRQLRLFQINISPGLALFVYGCGACLTPDPSPAGNIGKNSSILVAGEGSVVESPDAIGTLKVSSPSPNWLPFPL